MWQASLQAASTKCCSAQKSLYTRLFDTGPKTMPNTIPRFGEFSPRKRTPGTSNTYTCTQRIRHGIGPGLPQSTTAPIYTTFTRVVFQKWTDNRIYGVFSPVLKLREHLCFRFCNIRNSTAVLANVPPDAEL
jgi:hypothetical protein